MRNNNDRNSQWIMILLCVLFLFLLAVLVYNREIYVKAGGVGSVEIVAVDSANVKYVTTDKLISRLKCMDVNLYPKGRFDRSMMAAIEDSLIKDSWINRAEIFESVNGTLRINVWQRRPVLRIMNDACENYYLDEFGVVLDPDISYSLDVPIVTGAVDLIGSRVFEPTLHTKKTEVKDIFIEKLITFVGVLREDDFLRNFIVQINLDGDGNVELIPRVSNQIIRFGQLDEKSFEKLKSLRIFYSYSSSIDDFERIKEVDIRYVGQIIVKL